MRSLIMLAPFAFFALVFTGCAEQQPARTAEELSPALYFVPTTAMISKPQKPINAYALLPGSDSEFDFPRAEKGVYGSFPLYGIASFTTYTFDAQRIGTRDSFGYRYNWMIQQGISAPLAP